MRVTLAILEGPMQGKEKLFDEADIFIVGRMDDCHYFLVDDPYLSRHHFLLEINPPDITIRDLGSLNGTFINGKRFGGRAASESPDRAKPHGDVLALNDGDIIKCGKTEMKVVVSQDSVCEECGTVISPREIDPPAHESGPIRCASCQKASEKTETGVIEAEYPIPLEKSAVIKKTKGQIQALAVKDGKKKPGEDKPEMAAKSGKPDAPDLNIKPEIRNEPVPQPAAAKPRQPVAVKKPAKEPPPPRPALFKPSPDKPLRQPHPGRAAVPAAAINILIRNLLQNAAAKEEKPPEIKGYKILHKLGEGGFGAVYLAEDEKKKKRVALKIMLQQKVPTPKAIALFNREIEVNRKLRHKNIIHVEHYFKSSDLHCFALEYMDGGSVWELMREKGRLDVDEAVPVMRQILEGLAHAHRKKIIHRDIKPPNILLSANPDQRIAKLADFGLAKNFAKAGMTKTNITVAGDVCGSPPYMAPEHITNYRFVKAPTDVFEVAATFYHMLTGRIVWDLSGGINCYQAILQGTIKPIALFNPRVPQAVRFVIDKALSRDPAKRFQNGAKMLKAFKKAL